MKIGIDIDGVILDYENAMCECARYFNSYILNKNIKEDKNEFFYLKKYNWTDWEKKLFMKLYSFPVTMNCKLIDNCNYGINHLKDLGCELYCITGRGNLNDEIIKCVSNRLEREKIYFDNIIWKARHKVENCIQNDIDIIIDDNPDICDELSNNGIKCIYFNTSNRRHIEFKDNVIELGTWDEICNYIDRRMNKYKNYKLEK